MTTTKPTETAKKPFASNVTQHHIAVVNALAARENLSQGAALRKIIDHAEKTLKIKVQGAG